LPRSARKRDGRSARRRTPARPPARQARQGSAPDRSHQAAGPAPAAEALDAELRRAHQQLALRTVEIRNLVELGRELQDGASEAAVQERAITSVMGHFVVSRCALFLAGPGGLALVRERGLRRAAAEPEVPGPEARATLAALDAPRAVAELPEGPLRRWLEEARLALAVPLVSGASVAGLLAIGERASGRPFSAEDREIAAALARQAQAAFENARLLRVREEKLRQDRELQVARGIQQSLLPPRPPQVAGFELAALSRPCFEVGGDAYDWIPLASGRIGLVVADVSGKGTPASLLMASTHAFVHALAGEAPPAELLARLNRFLFARTQASRFVTLFYAELDPRARRLAFVNAGHVPPFRVARDGRRARLTDGGPALGLIEDAGYDVGGVTLEPGELVAMLTDGVTEAMSPSESELGDERVGESLARLADQPAPGVLAGLVAAVDAWAGPRGASDDLTALILKSSA
jgi:sigma-B regulation protein RsbU (phosphoserine phosphatase)